MVERDGGDRRGRGAGDHVGGVAATAEAHLQHAEIRRGTGEQQEGDGGDHLEHRDRRAGVDLLYLLQGFRQQRIGHEPAGEAEPLVEADQMRRGIDMHAQAGRFPHRAEEGAGAALAVGAGNMDHRRQVAFGRTKLGQQRGQAVEAEVDQPGMQPVQAGDQALDPAGGGRARFDVGPGRGRRRGLCAEGVAGVAHASLSVSSAALCAPARERGTEAAMPTQLTSGYGRSAAGVPWRAVLPVRRT